MAEMLIGKRHYHAFLSHAHVDKSYADALFRLLSGVAKIPIWYDAENLPPGATIAENLFQAIESSRAVIVLLSRQSVERGWAQQEARTVIDHQTRYPDFRIIPLLLDNVEPPNFLQNYSSIRIDQNGLDAITVTQIIKALYQPLGTTVDPSRGRHTYLSRGWHPDDLALGSAVSCRKKWPGGPDSSRPQTMPVNCFITP
jgi:TIR domain